MPVVALNRAVAVAELDGPAAALALVDDLPLTTYHLFHAVRADLLTRTGLVDEAAAAYDAAIARTANQTEQTFLRRRLDALRLNNGRGQRGYGDVQQAHRRVFSRPKNDR